MKILWLSNIVISDVPMTSSGGWIYSMFKELSKRNDILICNISAGNVECTTRSDIANIEQYIIPNRYKQTNGLPPLNILSDIDKIINTFRPDVIHVWGTEKIWGIITAELYVNKFPVLLEIQGLIHICKDYFYEGIIPNDLFKMLSLRDCFRPQSLPYYLRRSFKKWEEKEIEIIEKHRYINTQSEWVRGVISNHNDKAFIFNTGIILRDPFLTAKKWIDCENRKSIITVTGGISYKGLHITLKAFAIVKQKYPDLILKIAGVELKSNYWFNGGYIRYLIKLAKRLNIYNSIEWLGSLNAEQIINEYNSSIAYVNSSYIESYCLSLAEALTVGIPCVVSATSAMPELAIDNKTALTFTPGDYNMCAYKIKMLIEQPNLRNCISQEAIKFMVKKNDVVYITTNQVDTYNKILHIQ